MGFMTGIKASKAYRLQQKGQNEEARKLYEEAYAEGLDDTRFNLAYALLMIRSGEYQKAKDFLVKHQRTPGMSAEQRTTLLVDWAVCCFRLGDLDKGIAKLEEQFRKMQTGLLYQTLGYLYVEKYDAARRPDFEAMKEETELPDEPDAGDGEGEETQGDAGKGETTETEAVSPREAWEDAAEGKDAFECSEELEKLTGVPMPAQVKALRELPVRHTAVCERDAMGEAVLKEFGK